MFIFYVDFLKQKKYIAYYAFPAAVAVCEFFIDNPFVSVMTSLSVSQFWNIGLMQFASVTGVVGVSFIVTLFASVVNFILEFGIKKSTVMQAVGYGILVVIITGLGMYNVTKITTGDKTIRVAAGVENVNLLVNFEFLDNYEGTPDEKIIKASMNIINERAKQAVSNGAKILVFPEDAFVCLEPFADRFIDEVKIIAKNNNINILLPLLRLPVGVVREIEKHNDVYLLSPEIKIPEGENEKKKNTLNFINSDGELVNTYLKNHLVPVVEEPETVKGDGKTPMVEVDGVKIIYLICADYTSNKYAYNGREADIFINPSYDWKAFQYFTSYGVQARAIECGFSVLRNPVNGNIVLYDVNGRPLHMGNVMNVHSGMVYLDIPREGKKTIYGLTGNLFSWLCAIYIVFAILSGLFIKEKEK